VEEAVAGNPALDILAVRIEEAEAMTSRARADRLPTVGAAATGPGITYGPPASGMAPKGETYYSAGMKVSWELDIWGKLKKQQMSREAQRGASQAEWRAGYLKLVADVAETFFLIGMYDEQTDLQRRSLEKSRDILQIFEKRYQEGLASEEEVLTQRGEVHGMEASLEELQRQRQVAENRLAGLRGQPGGKVSLPAQPLTTGVALLDVPPGLPSDLLARRPDITATEYEVLSAYHLVGAARLAKLPSVSLTGSGGYASSALSSLLKQWTLGWAPTVDIPIFDRGKDADIRASEARYKAVEAAYRQTVINAFQEVEEALINLASHRTQKQTREKQIAALDAADARQRARLREGLASQLEILESERSSLQARQTFLQVYAQILMDTVSLYKAMGGGWPPEQVGAATP